MYPLDLRNTVRSIRILLAVFLPERIIMGRKQVPVF